MDIYPMFTVQCECKGGYQSYLSYPPKNYSSISSNSPLSSLFGNLKKNS